MAEVGPERESGNTQARFHASACDSVFLLHWPKQSREGVNTVNDVDTRRCQTTTVTDFNPTNQVQLNIRLQNYLSRSYSFIE